MERLRRYRWPGNVRELENLVRRLGALYADDVIGVEVIENELAEPPQTPRARAPREEETLTGAIERHLTKFFATQDRTSVVSGKRVSRRVEHGVRRFLKQKK